MTDRIQCFFLTPSNFAEESFRRYTLSDNLHCPVTRSEHDAESKLGIKEYSSEGGGRSTNIVDKSDSRWPTTCRCGYVFKPEDSWLHNLIRLYDGAPLGERVTLNKAPVGSMYYADWYDWKGPDGHCLVVVTPGGPWIVDGPSTGRNGEGPGWTRTGEIPQVTATPSIHQPGVYHGWLREGWLVSC
jgi:hypothetical protein